MPWEEPFFTSHKSSTFVHFKKFKTWFLALETGSTGPETGSTSFGTVPLPSLLWHVSQSVLSEKSLQIFWENRFNRIFSRLNRFWFRSSLRLSRLVNRVLPGGNRFNRSVNRFNRLTPLFSQRLPTFGGSFIYPPHSLSYLLLRFCLSHEILADQTLNKCIHFTFHTRNRISFNRLKDPWCEVNSI
jgi:hypothetical protein